MVRAFSALGAIVGAALSMGFGYLGFDAALDLYAFPAAPKKVMLAELARMEEVPRGTWVRSEESGLVKVAGPVQPSSGGPKYLLLGDRDEKSHVVVSCESASLLGTTTSPGLFGCLCSAPTRCARAGSTRV